MLSQPLRSRIAPTPSGYLHLGNAVNFLITWLITRRAHGMLKLRIDDADSSRARPEFIEDIFRQLDWLGIDWDEGASGPDDFSRHHSQQLRIERYRQALENLRRRSMVFPCSCSRALLKKQGAGPLYPGTCRRHAGTLRPGHPLRVHVPEETIITVEGEALPLCSRMGDFIVWRRDDLPSYQLVSLVDDLDDRINLIIRGDDLRESSAAQIFLARELGEEAFVHAAIHHHPLISAEHGAKLSKSDSSLSLAAMRAAGARPSAVYEACADMLGLPGSRIHTLDELVAGFAATPISNDAPTTFLPIKEHNLDVETGTLEGRHGKREAKRL